MIITETGIFVSTDPNMRDPAPLNFKIDGGQVGDNSVRATGLTADTTYYAQSYFVRDGMYIRQKGLTEFKTGTQEEVLKLKNTYSGSQSMGVTKIGSPNSIVLYYSSDLGETWNIWDSSNSSSLSVNIAQGGELWLKGNNPRLSTTNNTYYKITSGQPFECEGNVSALISKDVLSIPDYCFCGLFYGSKVTVLPDLPVGIPLGIGCFYNMYYNCTQLVTVPANYLPYSEIPQSCCTAMFAYCSALTSAPNLPALTVNAYAYYSMFSNCTSLVVAPELPATVVGDQSYYMMFYNCTSLTTAPSEIAATAMRQQTCTNMFAGCTSLVTVPMLRATTLYADCYSYMFKGCTSLVSVPRNMIAAEYPNTSVPQYVFMSMFNGCTSLVQGPDIKCLPSSYSHIDMFNGCTSLNKIYCYVSSWNSNNAARWVQSVAAVGDFYNLGGATIPIDSNSGVPIGWTLHTSLRDPVTLRNTGSGNNTIKIIKDTSNNWDGSANITLEYSIDGGSNWTSWSSTNGDLNVTLHVGGSIQFRGNNITFSQRSKAFFRFESSDVFSCEGNIMSLLDDSVTTVPEYAFSGLFGPKGDGSVRGGAMITSVSADFLPCKNLSRECYLGMFNECTLLSSIPSGFLPATTLAPFCYSNMFGDCSALTSLPSGLLPATTLAMSCYSGMFGGCTSLSSIPSDFLPATTLAMSCYEYMFTRCSFTESPILYSSIVPGRAYYEMFGGCSSLNKVVSYAQDISASNCTTDWLLNVSQNGSFYNLGGATYQSGASGIPTGWTEHTSL